MPKLAIDFGTSNTAAAVMAGERPFVIPLEDGEPTLPTAIFLDFNARRTLVGHAAVRALTSGREGRFMRALKSVLGTTLMREKRQFLNERLTLIEIVGRFLARVKSEAEAQCGLTFSQALSGRPVRFHPDPARDARALQDLTECYAAAGFEGVAFLPEPEAAALAAGGGDGLGLIVDIGGGTSDFTVFRRSGAQTDILASHGIRLGGTDFDRMLSLSHVMPLLGKGTMLKAELGPAQHEAPVSIFHDLATWATIPFLYTGQTRRDVARMLKLAVEPDRFKRLRDVLELELGHDMAFAVERGKIAAGGPEGRGRIVLTEVEPGLSVPVEGQELNRLLGPSAGDIRAAAKATLELAGTAPGEIERIVYVGGSSLLGSVSDAVQELLPKAEPLRGAAFTGIVDGLAIAAAK